MAEQNLTTLQPSDARILCIPDLEKAGSEKLERSAREFYNSGSTDQVTLHSNNLAFQKYRLRPRVLRPVSAVSTSTSCFGREIAFPLCISPAGIQAIAHPDGELATSRACAVKGVNMAVSTFATHPVEDIRAAGVERDPGIKHAMQMYTMRDRALQRRIIERAQGAGCTAIFLTADSPVLGVRYNEWRNDFRTPIGLGFPNLDMSSEYIRTKSHEDGFTTMNDPDHSWEREVAWLREVAPKMEIWVKGVLTAEDVKEAVRWGVDGVVVSNHGGRQLDGVPATIDVLAECAEAAKGSRGSFGQMGHWRDFDGFIEMSCGDAPEDDMNASSRMSMAGEDEVSVNCVSKRTK
ncbi:MAG: hypothetical protein OHK93_002694 [Ramalina farinacea]|uniref:FMN hydroxy acid dehydrogenase domain-containing protein n=1 Tax=Ramalina farinacea TaxID=258253 RepID=A0AA43QRY1_9LECA|nr:hypothetical protein [Ramalina farinacea]